MCVLVVEDGGCCHPHLVLPPTSSVRVILALSEAASGQNRFHVGLVV